MAVSVGSIFSGPAQPCRPLAQVGDIIKVLEVVLLFAAQVVALPGRRQGGTLCRELHVKVADVLPSLDGRHEWGWDFPLIERLPVHPLDIQCALGFPVQTRPVVSLLGDSYPEERLFLHIFSILLSRAKTSVRVPPQQLHPNE